MRTRLLLLTWIAATAAATGLAWLGVRSVVGDVAAPLPAPAMVAGSEPAADRATPAGSAAPTAPLTTTFPLTGGTATVRFSPDEVAVLSAVPAAGFETDVDTDEDDDTGDGQIRVEFESDTHRSRLDVWWDGAPRHRIQEQPDDDRDDADDDRDDADDD